MHRFWLFILTPILLIGCVTASGTNPTGLHGAWFTHWEKRDKPFVWTGTFEQFDDHLAEAIPDPAAVRLIVFMHGTDSGGRGQKCEPRDDLPTVFEKMIVKDPQTVVYYPCSNEIGFGATNNVSQGIWWKRAEETSRTLDRFLAYGVAPSQIVVAGHSGGASSALYMSTFAPEKFSGFVALAPGTGFGYLDRSIHDTWYSKHYYRWKNVIESGTSMRGVAFGFDDDKYSPLEEMAFIGDIPGVELVEVGNTSCSEGWIPHFYGYTKCFERKFGQLLEERFENWGAGNVVSK